MKKNDLYDAFLNNREKNIDKWHHYFEIYEDNFAQYKDKDILLLEIGVFKGGSLNLWKNYFGKKSKIIGIDINQECKKFEKDNIQIFIGDQKDPHFLSEIIRKVGKPDIIIDDGGHTSNQQITSFNVLYNHMKDNGTYLVEDTHTSYWQEWQDRPDGLTFMDYAKELSDKLNNWYKNHKLEHFQTKPEVRKKIEVPQITRNTYKIIFYNSIVVFKRKKIEEPYFELK